jgi:ribosome-associated heat shock protein Hsp15
MPDDVRVRLDKWLWAARFYKTRALAADAIDGGRIDVNGDRAKRAKLIQAGDVVCVRRSPFEWIVRVRAVSEHRGPAAAAQQLYEETSDSRAAREARAVQLRSMPSFAYDEGRPTKKDRRRIDRLRGR